MKRVKESSKVAMLIAMFAITFTTSAFAQEKGTFTDPRDKKKYKTVKIGEQTWMAENLNYLDKADKVSKCYDNKPANCTKYGRLYDWKTAMNNAASSEANPSGVQGVCPSDWHLPSNAEWAALMKFINPDCSGYNNSCPSSAGTKLKAKSGWNTGSEYIPGTDDYGFTALPGGGYSGDGFGGVGYDGNWWSSSEINTDKNRAYYRSMGSRFETVNYDDYPKRVLYSVRCVKD
jgi:uncharacterized protein (TIGR02145 family)